MTVDFMTIQDLPKAMSIEEKTHLPKWINKHSLDYKNAVFLVAKEKQKVIGVLCAEIVVDECSLNSIACDEEYRRKGVGKELIDFLIEECTHRGVTKILLEVREANFPAVTLYSKCGFDIVGKRENYYKHPNDNAVLMTLMLR